MSDELTQLREKVAQYEHRDRQAAVDGALAGAIQAAGVQLRPGVEAQVTSLLRGEVVEATAGGQSVLCGPGLKSLGAHVKDRLAGPEFEHFRVDSAPPPAGARPQPSGPMTALGAVSQGLAAMSGVGRGTVPTAETLGGQMIAANVAARQAAPDERLDMSRPMGLRAKG